MEDLELAVPNLEDEQILEQFFSEMHALAQRTRKRIAKREEIALRAYQIFLERGGLRGHGGLVGSRAPITPPVVGSSSAENESADLSPVCARRACHRTVMAILTKDRES
jgi:hypothetical protein